MILCLASIHRLALIWPICHRSLLHFRSPRWSHPSQQPLRGCLFQRLQHAGRRIQRRCVSSLRPACAKLNGSAGGARRRRSPSLRSTCVANGAPPPLRRRNSTRRWLRSRRPAASLGKDTGESGGDGERDGGRGRGSRQMLWVTGSRWRWRREQRMDSDGDMDGDGGGGGREGDRHRRRERDRDTRRARRGCRRAPRGTSSRKSWRRRPAHVPPQCALTSRRCPQV